MMMTKCTKLYDPGDNSLVSILPTWFFLLSNATALTFDLEKLWASSSYYGDQVYQVA
jgi:hypothetical protein